MAAAKSSGKYQTSAQKGTKVTTGSSSAMKAGKETGKHGRKGTQKPC